MNKKERQIREAGLTRETLRELIAQYESNGLWGPYKSQKRKRGDEGFWYVYASRHIADSTAEIMTHRATLTELTELNRVVAEFKTRGFLIDFTATSR